jgi:integrase
MAAPFRKTSVPGISKRGSRYYVRYYDGEGKYRSESCRTMADARAIKRQRETARDHGELESVALARSKFKDHAAEWVKRYMGNGRRGFTENTRAEYERDLARYAYPFLGKKQLGSIGPRDIAGWIAWLCDAEEQGKRMAAEKREKADTDAKAAKVKEKPHALSDATIRRILSPVRACFATARREGVVRSNPCDDAVLPNRPGIEDDEDKAKAMTREELAMFLRVVPAKWRTAFRFLAATGVRWSEFIALRWGDLRIDGSSPHVRVRRAIVKAEVKPPKSRHGKRDIPLDAALCRELRALRSGSEFNSEDDLVFPAQNGSPLRQENVRRRVLRIAAEEAGVPWIGFHSFRHTCASLLFANGRNVKQVQRWLGHHSPAFTLDTYIHLLSDGVGGGLDLDSELASANQSPKGGASAWPQEPSSAPASVSVV